jgi:hypothetical protein
VVLSS